jgi:hypothetical protein
MYFIRCLIHLRWSKTLRTIGMGLQVAARLAQHGLRQLRAERMSLPLAVRGSTSTNTIVRGRL